MVRVVRRRVAGWGGDDEVVWPDSPEALVVPEVDYAPREHVDAEASEDRVNR